MPSGVGTKARPWVGVECHLLLLLFLGTKGPFIWKKDDPSAWIILEGSFGLPTSFPGPFPYLECGAGKDPGIGWSRGTLHPEILGVINYRALHNQKYQNQDDGETVCAKSTWIWF